MMMMISFDDDDYNISSGIYWFDHHEDPINISLPEFGRQGYIGRTMVVFSCPGFILSGIEFFEFLGCEALLARPDCSSYEAHYHRPPLPTLGSICLFIQILIRSLLKETIMVRPLFGLDVVHSARYLHILAKPIPSEGAFWNSWVDLWWDGRTAHCAGATWLILLGTHRYCPSLFHEGAFSFLEFLGSETYGGAHCTGYLVTCGCGAALGAVGASVRPVHASDCQC